MQSSNKDVIKNSIWYTLGNILLKLFSFLLIPLYTGYLSPAQYGEINLALGFSNVVSCLIMCGLQTGVIRFYTDCNGNKQHIAEMLGSVLTFVIILCTIITVLLISSHSLWSDWFFSSIPFIPIVLLAILISAVTAVYTIYQEFLKGSHQAKKSVILSYIFFGLLLVSNIITIIVLRLGAQGVLASTFAVNFIMIVYMLIDLKYHGMLYFKIKGTLLKSMLKYSFPLVPHSLSYNISTFFTRVIINSKVSTSMLGLYSLASQFGGIADVVSNSVQSAFQPWLYERMKLFEEGNESAVKEIRNLTIQLLLIYGFIYLLIGAWTQEAIEIMSEKSYYSAWIYVPFLVMSVAIKSPLYFYQNLYYYRKNMTKYIFMFTVAGCITTMIFVWFLVPRYGVWGAIWGDIAGVCVRVLCTIWHGRKMIYDIYSIGNLLILTLFTILWLGITVFPSYVGWLCGLSNILYKLLCILLFVVCICVKSKINKTLFVR